MKCKSRFAKLTSIATIALVAMTSCSDDDKDYPANVYFTGALEPVQVVGAAGTKDPSFGQSAFNITFDAAGDWTISAHNLFNPQETATWVKFFTSAGSEGQQYVGVYADANPSNAERAATVEVNCKGSSISFTLIQQATGAVANPNAGFIDPDKTVTKIVNGSRELNFSYSNGNILSGIELVHHTEGDAADKYTTQITSDARATAAGIAVNKVVVTSPNMGDATYGVVNGKLAVSYNGTNLSLGNVCAPSFYGYNAAGNLTSVKGADLDINLGWTNGNLTSNKTDNRSQSAPANSSLTATYAGETNSSNIDLIWFLNFTEPGFDQVASAMNLMGVRSANLPSSIKDDKSQKTESFTYTDGVAETDGTILPGLTMTSTSNRTIKVYYAK